jgi:hypothetical protein
VNGYREKYSTSKGIIHIFPGNREVSPLRILPEWCKLKLRVLTLVVG